MLARANTDHVTYTPGVVTESARQREETIRRALGQGPATLDALVRRTGLSNAVLTAHLGLMVGDGLINREPLYSLPKPATEAR